MEPYLGLVILRLITRYLAHYWVASRVSCLTCLTLGIPLVGAAVWRMYRPAAHQRRIAVCGIRMPRASLK